MEVTCRADGEGPTGSLILYVHLAESRIWNEGTVVQRAVTTMAWQRLAPMRW